MEQLTPPDSPVVPAATMEKDVDAIVALLWELGPSHARKLRDLLEATAETRGQRQSAR